MTANIRVHYSHRDAGRGGPLRHPIVYGARVSYYLVFPETSTSLITLLRRRSHTSHEAMDDEGNKHPPLLLLLYYLNSLQNDANTAHCHTGITPSEFRCSLRLLRYHPIKAIDVETYGARNHARRCRATAEQQQA